MKVQVAEGNQMLRRFSRVPSFIVFEKKISHQLSARTLSTNVGNFNSGSNANYADLMYASWKKDPSSVHASWAAYFSLLEEGSSQTAFMLPSQTTSPATTSSVTTDSVSVSHLIRAFQFRGHEIASLDPLGLNKFRVATPSELDYKYHGFSESDLNRKLNLQGLKGSGLSGFTDTWTSGITLREVLDSLHKTYCSTVGVEFMHMASREKCNWIRSYVENPNWMNFGLERKLEIYERLCYADRFERFLGNKYNTSKRFGLEGGESVIPGLQALIDRGSELGITYFAIGMPHRGRLNVLANVMKKPFPHIFKEFEGTHYNLKEHLEGDWASSGDVKYHLGTSVDQVYPDGRKVHITLAANPSHLEAVDPVVVGKVRAKQYFSGNKEDDKLKHMPILMHGDAAFAGQGVVYETIQMSRVQDFAVGGTIHVIVNNQVGFTTDPKNGRSTMYSSDLGKAFEIPIFHCNSDDPLAVCAAFEMAAHWRQKFKEDCIIDVICYRRYGHNELDEPMFTQPQMYRKVASHPDTLSIYQNFLCQIGVNKDELNRIKERVVSILQSDYEKSKTYESPKDDWLSARWSGFFSPKTVSLIKETGVSLEELRKIGLKCTQIPDSFSIHKGLSRVYKARRQSIESGTDVDWATAESLAFGSLLKEGYHVRLTGQDVQRGTFSHRHAVLVDQENESVYIPLNNLTDQCSPLASPGNNSQGQAELICRNSILSEFAVLGFEHGYSMVNPNSLVLWEAQFGDFANGAQVMIDQFLAAGEDKWLRQSGLVMLLPHGYMGQGAEHSSCRIERFLQAINEDCDVVPDMNEKSRRQIQRTNLQVVNCTTPANYFHVLRRQIHRSFRKPLIIATPKNLLRDKRCTSLLSDMATGTRFKRFFREVDNAIVSNPDVVKSVIFCSGKIYYELVEARKDRKDVAIVRVEQIAPFPWDYVTSEMTLYKNAKPVWCQEEPKNMGAWSYVEPRFRTAFKVINKKDLSIRYAGRKPAASTATGLGAAVHLEEQKSLIEDALEIA